MNKRIDFQNLGGNPIDQQSLEFMQSSYRDAFAGIAKLCGEKVIINGMNLFGSNVSNGWLVYNGELIPFLGGALASDIVIQETKTPLTFQDNLIHDVEITKVAKCGSPGDFPFSDLKRLSSLKDDRWQTGDIKMINCNAAYIAANFDGNGIGINERIGWKICSDMNGRSPLGYDPTNATFDIGNTGGEAEHVLSVNEMPGHSHTFETDGDTALDNNVNGYPLGRQNPDSRRSTRTTSSVGGNAAHNNMHPYKVVLFIEKL